MVYISKIWVNKVKKLLPANVHKLLEPYLNGRTFEIQYKILTILYHTINAGVLHDEPGMRFGTDIVTSTFANNTAFLAAHDEPDSKNRKPPGKL